VRSRLPLLADLPREVAVLAAIAFFVALGFGIVIPAIPIFASTFGVSALAASSVVAAFAFMRFTSSPLAGWLTNRFGERVILATGLIIVAVSSAVAGLSQTFVQLLVLRGVGGIGSSMFTVSALALLLRVVEAPKRGRASAAFQAGFLFGGVAGPAAGGIVLAWSVRAPFFFYAGTLAIATVVALVFLTRAHLIDKEDEVESAEAPTASATATLTRFLRMPAYRAALGVNFLNGFVTFGIRAALIPLFVIEGLRQGAGLSGAAFLVAAAAQAIALLPAGRMADLRGRRPAMLIGTSATILGMSLLVLADVIAGATTPAVLMMFLAMAILGVAVAYRSSAPAAAVGDLMGGRRGGIPIAVFQMTADIGSVLGPLAAGALLDAAGFSWAFTVGAVASALVLILVWRSPETLQRSLPGTPSTSA
jgi:DHA1 family multidrug resistance protein-like MFS transporter